MSFKSLFVLAFLSVGLPPSLLQEGGCKLVTRLWSNVELFEGGVEGLLVPREVSGDGIVEE